jgi:pimeloyl-ACP methyl ester carboxylesterase
MTDRFQVFALDARGHGETEWAQDYTLDLMTEDSLAFVSTLGLRRPVLLGLSMGGINAYLHAARDPDTVARLVIVDIAPDVTDILSAARSAFERSPTSGWPPVVVDLAEARLLARTEPPILFDDPEAAYYAACQLNPRPPETEQRLRVLHGLIRQDDGQWTQRHDPVFRSPIISTVSSSATQWSVIAGISCPTLVVRGAESDTLSRETAERMVRTIPNCRLTEVADSGHTVPLDNPMGFLAAVRPFLLEEVM